MEHFLYSGFHEAIGDTMALAVVTPNHLEKIGLLKKEQLESNEKVELVNGMKVSKNDLTYLFSKSLDKVIFRYIFLGFYVPIKQ